METVKVVSQFEYAILKIVAETDPAVLNGVRAITDEEIAKQRLEKEIEFLSKIKYLTPKDEEVMQETIATLKSKTPTWKQ